MRPPYPDSLRAPRRWWQPSIPGLLLGGLWLALSFTPSLIPRPWLLQGLLGGIAFALGYWVGAALAWLWRYLELPEIPARLRRPIGWGLAAAILLLLGGYLWNAAQWQDTTRALMGMPPVEQIHFLSVLLVTVLVALLLIALVKAIIFGIAASSRLSHSYLQRRVASVVGAAAFVVLLVWLVNGTLVSTTISAIDRIQAATDVADPEGAVVPTEATRSGSAGSLVAWDDLGKAGKQFVSEGPRQADIAAFTGRAASEPIRVFVGLRAAHDPQAQADLALRELERTGAFARKVLVIATPTGTGWVDNAGIAPLEYMQDGDTAVVGVQYSYMQSPLSLILEPGRSQASAAVVFATIYQHWRQLPKAERPKLYLFGLSLGSHGSETSAPLFAFISDPFQGAVWAGPPFRNALWRDVQRNRNPGSPAWLPSFEDGSLVRVIGPSQQEPAIDAPWGPIRIVYLVNPSDAIVFFEEAMWYREPDWMQPPRGADISPRLRWVPVITFFQVALDMMTSAAVPPGHGHNYAPGDYADAWVAVSAPETWSADDAARLRERLSAVVANASM